MTKMIKWLSVEKHRAYVYRVLLAAAVPAVGYGLVTEQEVEWWALLASNVLGVGLATRNTTTQEN